MRLRTFGGLWLDLAADSEPPRPRGLALLAMLAAAAGKGLSRDRVVGVLWPDSDTERARHALSQTLYGLRRVIGADVVLSTPELCLDTTKISSEIEDFRVAVRDKNWSAAADLYAGPFLDGFYLEDAPEFERWAETERAALATDAIRAIETVAAASSREGAPDAARHWRRLALLDPLSSRFAASYMEALAVQGDRAAALAHGKAHAELLRAEFGAQPDPTVQQLMTRLRSAEPLEASRPTLVAPASAPRRRPVMIAVTIAAALAVTAFIGWRSIRPRPSQTPMLAVGRIRDLVAPESAAIGSVLSEMLSTSLGRIGELQVVANSRMLELAPRGDTSRNAFVDAARRAGATEIIEGELLPMPERRLRLEMRRVDLRRGTLRGGYRLTGDDRIALFDSVTNLIAGDLRVGVPAGSLAEVSTRSPIAYRFYEEGLRAFYQFDAKGASRLLDAAVREDSNFAMAAYYAWRAGVATGDPNQSRFSELALRLATRATARDRLLIRTHVGLALSDPLALAAAETLATNHPNDPEALIRSAEVIPELSRASLLLNRSIELDSLAGRASTALCRLCDALQLLAQRYRWADSMEAADRTLRRWTTLRPTDYVPWGLRADLLFATGRYTDAAAASRRYDALGGPRSRLQRDELVHSIQSGDLDAALGQCNRGLLDSDSTGFAEFRWYCAIALRAAGRYRDARALVNEGRIPGTSVVRRGIAPDHINAAILDMETGRALAAANTFRRLYRLDRDSMRIASGAPARYTTWVLALSATAAIAGGDTTRARFLLDTIETVGQRSLYARDRRLHHFIRGLLLGRAGKLETAVAEYRAAISSPTYGYTRINYELGRTLLRIRRPAEGIAIVRAALHGGIDGPNLYVTHTELHELLAQLFDAAGQRDSATAHYLVVKRAWLRADPFIQPKYEAAERWLAREAGR